MLLEKKGYVEMISIIVPVYNIKRYVEKCVKSILNQTYKDTELLLIDDGSTDGSSELCEQLAQSDSRIRVIHKKNGGLSDARNVGLKEAKGEYIGFVDGDDYIHPQMYEILLKQMVEQQADMVYCDFETVHIEQAKGDKKQDTAEAGHVLVDTNINIMEADDVLRLVTNLYTKDIVAWNKLYRREILEDLLFEKNRLHEDLWMIPYISLKCKRVVYVDVKCYYYVEREGSITTSNVTTKRMYDLLDALANGCELLKEKQKHDAQLIVLHHLCNYIMYYYENAGKDFGNKAGDIKKELKFYLKRILQDNQNVVTFRMCIYKLFTISPSIAIVAKHCREMMQ